jgi:hypothetical protein
MITLIIVILFVLWLFAYKKIDIFTISNTQMNEDTKQIIKVILITLIIVIIWQIYNDELDDFYGNKLTGVKEGNFVETIRKSEDPFMDLRTGMVIWRHCLLSAFVSVLFINFIFQINMSLEKLIGITLVIFIVNLMFMTHRQYHLHDIVHNNIREKYKAN